jgi:hypothetical protein
MEDGVEGVAVATGGCATADLETIERPSQALLPDLHKCRQAFYLSWESASETPVWPALAS